MADWVDMSVEPSEEPGIVKANYPYGLCISLTDDQFEKLELDNPDVGDMLEMTVMVKVTSFSEHETMGKRAELQIMAIKELEDDGDEDDYAPSGKFHETMYSDE